MPAFSQSLETALHRALEMANERNHEYATLEHLLLALIDDRDAAAVMRACNVSTDELKARVTEYIDNELSALIVKGSTEAQPTTGFQRVIHRAVVHVQSSGREEVTGANVLVAIFAERESHATYLLQEQEMTRFDAVQYISHGIAKRAGMSEQRPVRGAEEDATSNDSATSGFMTSTSSASGPPAGSIPPSDCSTVASRPDSDVVITDSTVSRTHAEIVRIAVPPSTRTSLAGRTHHPKADRLAPRVGGDIASRRGSAEGDVARI